VGGEEEGLRGFLLFCLLPFCFGWRHGEALFFIKKSWHKHDLKENKELQSSFKVDLMMNFLKLL